MTARLHLPQWPPALPWSTLIVLVLAPLLWFPGNAPPVTALALLLLLAIVVAPTLRRRAPAYTPLNLPLLVYLGLSALAFLAAPLPEQSVRRLLALFLGAGLYLAFVPWLLAAPARLLGVVRLLALAGALLAVVGLFALEWPERYLFDLSPVTARLPHLSSGFHINHNQMAGALILLLPLVLSGWRSANRPHSRLLFGASVVLMLLALFLTQSRNALLALLLAGVSSLLWRGRRFWPLLLLALLLVALPFLVAGLPASQELLATVDRLDAGSKAGAASDQSWLGRLEMWRAAIAIMGDYALPGAGLYSFDQVSRANYVYDVVRPTFPISHAHNLFLQVGAGLGWPGWLAAVSLWLSLLFGLWQAAQAAPVPFQRLGRALGTSLLAYLSFNSFDVLALEQRAGLLAWLLLALATAYTACWGSVAGNRLRWLQLAPLALALLLLPALPHSLAHLRLDRARLAGGDRQALDPGQMGNARRRGLVHFLQGRPELAQRQWAQDPEAISYLLNQGQQAFFEGQPQAALAWCEQALALEPEAALAYYWQGAALEAMGDGERALVAYRQAVALAAGERVYAVSVDAAAWEGQGRLLVAQERWQAAQAAFAQALSLEPGVADYRQQLADVEAMLEQMEAAP